MKDSAVRALRTFVQAFLGALLASGVFSAFQVDGFVDFAVLSKAAVSAISAGIIAGLSYLQNILEDTDVIPSTKGTN